MNYFDRQRIEQLFIIAQDVPAVGQARLAASIWHRNELIAVGVNERKTHPLQAKYAKHPDACFMHAEIAAIKNGLRKTTVDVLAKSTLYIARAKYNTERTEASWGMAKPCLGCTRAVEAFDLRRVVFTTDVENQIEEWRR